MHGGNEMFDTPGNNQQVIRCFENVFAAGQPRLGCAGLTWEVPKVAPGNCTKRRTAARIPGSASKASLPQRRHATTFAVRHGPDTTRYSDD